MPLTAISLPHSAFNIGTHNPEPLDARPFDCLTKTQAQEIKPPVNLILKAIFAGPSLCLPMQRTQSLECGLCCTNRAGCKSAASAWSLHPSVSLSPHILLPLFLLVAHHGQAYLRGVLQVGSPWSAAFPAFGIIPDG